MWPGAQTVEFASRNVSLVVSLDNETPFMSEIFAMQRANGDWFAFDDDGRLRVPLFHSRDDAMMARLHNLGLQLYKPVVLDTLFLKEIAPLRGEDEVDFCMIDDPFVSLNRGRPMTPAQVASLMGSADAHQRILWKANTSEVTLLNASSN